MTTTTTKRTKSTMQLETHDECYQSLREDRVAGLIYGPFVLPNYMQVVKPGDSGWGWEAYRDRVFVTSSTFAAATGQCTYCGNDLPRNRKLKLCGRVSAKLRVLVALNWRTAQSRFALDNETPTTTTTTTTTTEGAS